MTLFQITVYAFGLPHSSKVAFFQDKIPEVSQIRLNSVMERGMWVEHMKSQSQAFGQHPVGPAILYPEHPNRLLWMHPSKIAHFNFSSKVVGQWKSLNIPTELLTTTVYIASHRTLINDHDLPKSSRRSSSGAKIEENSSTHSPTLRKSPGEHKVL